MPLSFTEELERRLRELLSRRVQAPLPSDVPIEVAPVARAAAQGSLLVVSELQIRTTAHPYAAWSYQEPGAWGKLLADLAAIPDAPAAPADRGLAGP